MSERDTKLEELAKNLMVAYCKGPIDGIDSWDALARHVAIRELEARKKQVLKFEKIYFSPYPITLNDIRVELEKLNAEKERLEKMDNPQAFPSKSIQSRQSALQAGIVPYEHYEEGMTLRDYFAGQVLVGLITYENGERLDKIFKCGDDNMNPKEYFSNVAYSLADSMLAERSKRRDQT